MSILYKDISQLSQKSSVAGNEKLPVSATEYITPAQIVLGREATSNKVTSLSSSSTDTQYPSAKTVYDLLYESLLITLVPDAEGSAADLLGTTVTVINAETQQAISTQTWQGSPLSVHIKAGIRYTVSAGEASDYIAPSPQTFASEINSTRSVVLTYVYSTAEDLSMYDSFGTALAAQCPANSYVVLAAGSYKIPAIYGNAVKAGQTNAAAYTRQGSTYTADFVNYKGQQITSPYIETDTGESIASAGLLWQTAQGMITDVSFSGGYVSFSVASVPSTNGLAVLVVRDGSGNIMWSWTLWLTTEVITEQAFVNHTGVTYNLMPENLFAVWNAGRTSYASPTMQWGRKDVFVPNIPGENTQMTVYDINGDAITPGATLGSAIGIFGTGDDASAYKTVANAIRNPGMFFTRYDATNYSWNNLPWFNNFWNAAETSGDSLADNQDTAVKTVYDPCPYGWTLPAGRAFTGFTTTGENSSTSSQFNVIGSFSGGWTFKRSANDASGNKFLASGYRVGASGAVSHVGSLGIFWTFAPASRQYARYLNFGSGLVGPLGYNHRATGVPVRPSRESS